MPRGNRFRKGQGDESLVVVFGRERTGGQDGDAKPRSDHMADGLQRVSLQPFHVGPAEFRTGFQNLKPEAVASMGQNHFLAAKRSGVDGLSLDPWMIDRDDKFELFLVEQLGDDAGLIEW